VLFEATLLSGVKMARVDILVKRGDDFEIVEVKSKSYDGEKARQREVEGKPSIFHGVRGAIDPNWKEYLLDVAFQMMLLRELYPAARVRSFLMMPDKSKTTGIEDIHRQFTLRRTSRAGDSFERTEVSFTGDRVALRESHFLSKVDISAEVAELMAEVTALSTEFAASLTPELRKIPVPISTACAGCEYRVGLDVRPNGFAECWEERAHAANHILGLYKGGTAGRRDGVPLLDTLIAKGAASILDIPLESLVKADGTVGADDARRRRQIEVTRSGRRWVSEGLRPATAAARYPLHFIDFETSTLAVPYHAGMRPYEMAAFQWSCHSIAAPGAGVEHAEWLNTDDAYPNFDFARSLRDQIGSEGTVLMWAPHERTTLRATRAALDARSEVDDDLDAWLRELTREGNPRLLDMNRLALRHYLDPVMQGRTTIKLVLDAVWRSDPLARAEFTEYSHGAESPYKALPPLLIDGREVVVREGLGAVRAYQEMMYGAGRGNAEVKGAYRELLLNYCRLDTAAMVIIWRHWGRESSHESRVTSG